MSDFSKKLQGYFMLMVMQCLTALLSKAFNQGNYWKHFDLALDSIENFQKQMDSELPE